MEKDNISEIKTKIHTIREIQVILDEDLARLYNVEVRTLNQAVKRNNERFPKRFVFQLTKEEYAILKSQIVISSWGGKRTLPYVFNEQGVAMLSNVLKSKTAMKISIQIMDAFVAMRRFITSNSQIFYRLDYVERKQIEYQLKTNKNFEEVFDAIEDKKIKPKQGIFFDGQIFDAYRFVSDLIKSAKKSIILIDNFIDDTVLTMFSECNVNITIYTKNISGKLKLDLIKYNSQYKEIKIIEFEDSHDRFLIIDDKNIFHFGASLKDLGKKWFAFSRFDNNTFRLIDRIKKTKY